ncbi:hypothetical protein [Streptomyces sp. NPDC006335]|uniref:hypothetical protein n=1 Tax=Streptomyces sp. NPDC006335 TaxID=3156895 RepID=UPI0033BA8776
MVELQMSPEVRTLLGPDGMARAAEISLTDATCMQCQKPLSGTVNVVARTNHAFTHVVYVHDGCGPSQVLAMGEDFAPVSPADGYSMTMTAALIHHGSTPLPVLVAETVSKVYLVHDGPQTELTSVIPSHLLSCGFALVSRLRQAPPQVAEWVGVLLLGHGPAGEDGLLVLEPDGAKFYVGSVELPDGWLAQAARYGWAVLYAGDIGLADTGRDDKAVQKALRTAAQAGRLVGARIAVGIPAPNH